MPPTEEELGEGEGRGREGVGGEETAGAAKLSNATADPSHRKSEGAAAGGPPSHLRDDAGVGGDDFLRSYLMQLKGYIQVAQ